MARWADGARRRARRGADGPADDERLAAGRARTLRAGQDARRDRHAVGRPARRRIGAGLVGSRLPFGGHPVRRAMGAVRRSCRRHARAVGCRRPAVRRALLRHVARRSSAAAPGAADGTADLDRQLGVDRRAPSRGPARGRLAGVRLQHDPGVLRDGLADAQRHARGGGSRSVDVPVHDGDDLAVRHRRCGRGASRLRASEPDAPSARSRTSWAGCRSAHPPPVSISSAATGMPVCSVSWSGRCGTRSSSSSVSRPRSSPTCDPAVEVVGRPPRRFVPCNRPSIGRRAGATAC